eukprot:TRINITY_DN14119_c0_g5_i1.p2 TRINITY_DN14119_c0_g5~~TRINITY_DN14119_c0_g5_i1.p2  ORF type:complete len:122 (+),score=1.64 TRINITY_DN14119_c0_g5_i1:186-551(+)
MVTKFYKKQPQMKLYFIVHQTTNARRNLQQKLFVTWSTIINSIFNNNQQKQIIHKQFTNPLHIAFTFLCNLSMTLVSPSLIHLFNNQPVTTPATKVAAANFMASLFFIFFFFFSTECRIQQ